MYDIQLDPCNHSHVGSLWLLVVRHTVCREGEQQRTKRQRISDEGVDCEVAIKSALHCGGIAHVLDATSLMTKIRDTEVEYTDTLLTPENSTILP